jgi:hypothetical protein
MMNMYVRINVSLLQSKRNSSQNEKTLLAFFLLNLYSCCQIFGRTKTPQEEEKKKKKSRKVKCLVRTTCIYIYEKEKTDCCLLSFSFSFVYIYRLKIKNFTSKVNA